MARAREMERDSCDVAGRFWDKRVSRTEACVPVVSLAVRGATVVADL